MDYNYWTDQQTVCPQCGSTADVRTVQDVVAMFDGMQAQLMQMGDQSPQPRQRRDRERGDSDHDGGWESAEQEVAGALLKAAFGSIGRAIGKRARQAYSERLAPTLEATSDQRSQHLRTIAEQHPDVRACFRDQVIFLAGGTRTLPLSEVSPQITPAQADALVARLQG